MKFIYWDEQRRPDEASGPSQRSKAWMRVFGGFFKGTHALNVFLQIEAGVVS